VFLSPEIALLILMSDTKNSAALTVEIALLKKQNANLKKINHALIERVENHGHQYDPYTAFEHSVHLAEQVREKTEELNVTFGQLEKTNRELTEANSQANLFKQRFLDAIESMSEALVLLDCNRRVILHNSNFSSFWEGLGFSIGIGASLKDSEERAKSYGIISQAHPSHTDHNNTVYKISDDRWFQLNECPTIEGGWVIVYSDITVLKIAEKTRYDQAMAKKSFLLQSLIDNLSQGIILIGKNKHIEVWNNCFSIISQLSPQLLSTRPYLTSVINLTELNLEPKTKNDEDYYMQTLSNGMVLEIRERKLKNGKLIKTYTDITKRHHYSESLKKSEQWLRLITDNVPAMIAYVGADLKFQFTNRVYNDWYGFSPTELSELESQQKSTTFDFNIIRSYVDRALNGESVSFETEETNQSGKISYLLKSYVPNIDGQGNVHGFFVLVRNITKRRTDALALQKAYDQLEVRVQERTSELQREVESHQRAQVNLVKATKNANLANISKTKFLAAVSHDLLQPLNAAQLFTSSLAEQESDSKLQSLIHSINNSLNDLENLICTLVDISKLDAGLVKADKSYFKLSDLLDKLAAEYQQQTKQFGVTLHYVSTEAVVHSDSILLARVLRNFLSNAFRYADNGNILLGCRRQGDHISIEVWDNGVGIAEDEIGTIFEEFKRLKSSHKQFRNGLGLGLAITEKISKVLRQPLKVKSTQHRGSMFSIQVPLATVALQPVQKVNMDQALQNTILAHYKVWFIDNNADICESMSVLLGGWDCDIVTATSLEHLQQQVDVHDDNADILIVDYHLGDDETGLSVVKKINEGRRVALPVLMITANYSNSLKNKLKNTNILLLNKPVKPMKLKTSMLYLLK